jgi:hypothetical protein
VEPDASKESCLRNHRVVYSVGLLGVNTEIWQCCNLQTQTGYCIRAHVCSGCQIEEIVDELNLPKKIISCRPSSLPLPVRVDCFVALNRSPSRLEFSEALLGFARRLMAR